MDIADTFISFGLLNQRGWMMSKLFILKKDLRIGYLWIKDHRLAVLLGLILFLGAVLRFYDLGAESYWVDEMYTVIESQQSVQQLLSSGRLDQPPGYYLPFHAWVQIFGTAELSTRSFSALTGIGSLILIYLIGQRLFGAEVGIISVLLMAISDFQITYSQETRFYTFFQLTTLFSFLFLILSFENIKRIYLALYCVASIFMLYSHTYGVFILAAQNLFVIVQVKKHKNLMSIWLICQMLILLAFLPYFTALAFGNGGMGGAVTSNSTGTLVPSVLDPLRFVWWFIMPARETRSWVSMLSYYAAAGILLIVGILISFILLGKSGFVTEIKKMIAGLLEVPEVKDKLLLASCWLLCPVILPFILSFLVAPMYRDRYMICAAPALYLLLALAIFSARKVMPILISLGALAVIIVPGLQYYYDTDAHQQWREAAAYVKENSVRNEIIVFAGGMGTGIEQKSFKWYYRDALQDCALGNELKDSTDKFEFLAQCISGYDHFWVLIRNSTEFANPIYNYKTFFKNLDQTDIHLLKEEHFVDITVYLFKLTR